MLITDTESTVSHQVHRLKKMLSAAEEEHQKTQLEAEASASAAESEIDRYDTNQVYLRPILRLILMFTWRVGSNVVGSNVVHERIKRGS